MAIFNHLMQPNLTTVYTRAHTHTHTHTHTPMRVLNHKILRE